MQNALAANIDSGSVGKCRGKVAFPSPVDATTP